MSDIKDPAVIDVQKNAPTKEINLANTNKIWLSSFFDNAIYTKSISNDDLNNLAETSVMQDKSILNILDILISFNPVVELKILKNIFRDIYGYKIELDSDTIIPIVIKELFSENLPTEWKFFKKENVATILSSTFIPFDINRDTLIVLSRTPELPLGFKDKIEPLLKEKRLKNVEVRLTTKELYEYYKHMLTYNKISDEI